MDTLNPQELEKYLATGRTLCEIAKDFTISIDEATNLIESFKNNNEFDVFPTVNRESKRIFIVRRKSLVVAPAQRIWSHVIALDEKGKPQPYIIVLIPDDVPWEKIKVYVLGDMHYGSKSFDAAAFDAFLRLVSAKDHALIMCIGDLIENALGDSVGGAVYEQIMSPDDQILEVRELIRPIAHKIVCMTPGNHEWRSFKVANLDPLKYGVCEHLGIPYFSEPVHVDILWHGKIFTFFVRHGGTNSQTKGGKLKAAARPLSSNEFTMFTVSGHTHDPMSEKNVKRCREFIRDEEGNVIDMRIVKRIEYVVICPAFYEPWTNYGARAGYPPVSRGIVQACVLEPDGRYRVENKPLIIQGR